MNSHPRWFALRPLPERNRILGTFLLGCLIVAAMFSPVTSRCQAQDPSVERRDPLLDLVDQAILVTKHRNLDFQVHTPWQILHGLLALREDYQLRNGKDWVNAVDWISTSATFKGQRWFEATRHGGRAHPYNGTPYDFEGHVNQTLAIIAMCNLPLEHEFHVGGGKTVTMQQMVDHAKMAVNDREETTWTLWFLTHYLDQDEEWTNAAGEHWSMERLVRIQSRASLERAPCGGCHNLFAIAYARNSYLRKHGQLRGAWLEADQKLQKYIAAARAMQNRDASFATSFFKARGFSNDFNERIKSSGHMLEWLMVALPRKSLDDRWVRSGVQTLANDLLRNASKPADCGPLYHSLHALVLYKQRIEPEQQPSQHKEELARTTPKPVDSPVQLSRPEAIEELPETSIAESAPVVIVPRLGEDDATPDGEFQPPVITPAPTVVSQTPEQSPSTKPGDMPKITAAAPQTTVVKNNDGTQKPGDSQTKDELKPTPGTPATTPAGARPPLQIAEEPANGVKRLAAEEPTSEDGKSRPITVELAPFEGAMPIYRR